MDLTKLRKNNLFVGRASTAIYLILKTKIKGKEVILPANICYAAVYPVIYSQNTPVFVDINRNTGNADLESIIKATNENTGAIIYPYMYGNVSNDILELKKYCYSHNIILIEDCASTMGAYVKKNKIGTIGDYAIFSTGHAKIIDVGNGGILVTDNEIDDIKKEYEKLPYFNDDIYNNTTEFSKAYRMLRNEQNNEEMKEFFARDNKKLFLYKIDKTVIENMKTGILHAENILKEREKKYYLYSRLLERNKKIKILEYEEKYVPWRFNIIIKNQEDRKNIINILLKNNLFVSDWYPCIGSIFSNEKYTNSLYMEKRILNFSLTDKEENIEKICSIINNYFKGSKK